MLLSCFESLWVLQETTEFRGCYGGMQAFASFGEKATVKLSIGLRQLKFSPDFPRALPFTNNQGTSLG